MSAPNGPTVGSMKRLMADEEERKKKLNESEYKIWKAYRTKIRDLLQEFGHDPFASNTDAGPINWKARALMRMVGRYLKEPWDYSPRSSEELDEIITNSLW